jgi:hypothetical protein
MTKYTVTYDDGQDKGVGEFDAPERLPQSGDIYEWVRPARTLGGYSYDKGDLMTVVERTGHVPFYRTSSLGNLLVKGKHHTSVWTCFELCIAEGSLRLVGNLGL